ncbi:DUF805 domain-containing protein [Pseudomonas sp. NPDC089401]|uniref:DUF805 domain-containing protein n=1 Tax=Pseudomonas sp. NPDC089401 TaxID=3364462 RepID=UPI00382594BA
MSMVFCRGCAKQIHESAVSCPGCGATQVASGAGLASSAVANDTPITFGNVFFEVMKKYATFKGRARRKEYWLFVLISTLILFALAYVEAMVGSPQVISGLYNLAVFIPTIAVGVRRLHDNDHSGWWMLVPIVNLIFMIQDGTRGDNRFGPDPKTGA